MQGLGACQGRDEQRRGFGCSHPSSSPILQWFSHLALVPALGTRDVAVLSPLVLLLHLPRAGRVKPRQFFFPTHTTSYRCLNCWGFVHLVQFIPNNSSSRFSPPLGTPFLSLAAEADPGASRIEPQEVQTASSRLRIPSWVLNALHQRAVGHHINQEL